MGFEQLAALKEQLAKQAKQTQQEKNEKKIKPHAQKVQAGRQKKAERFPRAASRADQQNADPDAAHKRAASIEPVNPVVLTIGRLQKHFPNAFPKNPAPKVPLKLGIHKDLLAQASQLGLTEAAILEAVKTWCWGKRYWACVVENACRVDLAGQEAGRVLATEAARSRALEARRYSHTKTKKAAHQQEHPEEQQEGEAALSCQQQKPLEQNQDAESNTIPNSD